MATLQAALLREHSRRIASTAVAQKNKPLPTPTVRKTPVPFLAWLVVSMGAYIGYLVRTCFTAFYQGPNIKPATFTVLVPNILGSFILGWVSDFQTALSSPTSPKKDRMFYMFLATGLCGSLTSMSTWHTEMNKLFILQLDHDSGVNGRSYSGGWLLDWATSFWIGVAAPLGALYVGQHVAREYKKRTNWKNPIPATPAAPAAPNAASVNTTSRDRSQSMRDRAASMVRRELQRDRRLDIILFGLYVVSSIVVFVFPPTDVAISCFLGASGAYTRYWLANLNRAPKAPCRGFSLICDGGFPLGTLIANILGCLILAITNVLLKFTVSMDNIPATDWLVGFGGGFCGCLSTMSTFVLEIDRLSAKSIRAAFLYVVITMGLCQLVVILVLSVPAQHFALVAQGTGLYMGPQIDVCSQHVMLCNQMLSEVNCAPTDRVSAACGSGGVAEFVGTCTCGAGFDPGDRISQLIVDSQIQSNVSHSLVYMWPEWTPSSNRDIGSGYDLCLSYENLCSALLNRINCPAANQVINACNRQGRTHWEARCECGTFTTPSSRVTQLLVDQALRTSLVRDLNLTTDVCGKFKTACGHLLNRQMCPPSSQLIGGCAVAGDPSTFSPVCQCFSDDGVMAQRVTQKVLDTFEEPYTWSLVVQNGSSVDACSTVQLLCQLFLDHVGCPPQQAANVPCDPSAPDPTNPNALMPNCTCGGLDASAQSAEWMIDAVLGQQRYQMKFVPPVTSPFYLAAKSFPSGRDRSSF